MGRICNVGARAYVARKEPFMNNNSTMWAEWIRGQYVVFSYRYSWPMYIYDKAANIWIMNTSRFSRTTSRHASCAYVNCELWFDCDTMNKIYQYGYSEFLKRHLNQKVT